MSLTRTGSRLSHNPVLARIIEQETTLPSGITATGALSAYAQNAAAAIRDNRDREKREIADLNNRLARYVEKVRFLEAQNRVLENDIGLFRQAAYIHSERITVYYEAEKTSLATLVRESEQKVSSWKQNIRKMEPELVAAQKNWTSTLEHRRTVRMEKRDQMKRLSDIEAENAYVKRLYNDCDEEKAHIKSEISRIRGEIKRILAQRDKERSGFSRSQSNAQELLKKLNGSISQHEIAIREEINKARRDSTDKNREYFHKELHLAMKEIRDNFESETKKTRKTWEEWYKKKISDIKKNSERFSLTQNQAREEVLRIRSFLNELRTKISDADTVSQQLIKRIEDMKLREDEELRMFEQALTDKQYAVDRMRDECTKLSVELEKLMENQINLRNEIAHYRKLMENAEHLRTTYQSNVVIDTPSPLMRTRSHHSYGSAFTLNVRDTHDHIVQHTDYDISNLSTINSQQFRSFSKGDVKIIEHKDESIVIENSNGYKSKDLSNWKLHHYVNGALTGTFIFPVATHIHPHEKIAIHSTRSINLLDDMIAYQISSFNFGKGTKTVLVDDADEEVGWYAHVTYSH